MLTFIYFPKCLLMFRVTTSTDVSGPKTWQAVLIDRLAHEASVALSIVFFLPQHSGHNEEQVTTSNGALLNHTEAYQSPLSL